MPENLMPYLIPIGIAVAIIVVIAVGVFREKKYDLSQKILAMPLLARWLVYFAVIFGIMTFGTYGSGFDANAFIYGGF